jgi:gluconokinase
MLRLPIVVMGVSGAGKSTLGRALAQALGWRFVEGDNLHPPANVAKMSSGTPLTDEDRAPWIVAIGKELAGRRASGVVVACSALRRAHRDALRAAAGDLSFVLPVLTREALESRMAARTSHFMPASLLDSQLLTFEPPGDGERVVRVPGTASIEEQVASALRSLAAAEQGQ